MRLSVLLNRKVVSESGQRLGRVHDVRGELEGGRLRVTGLIAGKLPRALWRRHPRQRRPGTSEGTRPPRHPLGAGRPRRVRDSHPRLVSSRLWVAQTRSCLQIECFVTYDRIYAPHPTGLFFANQVSEENGVELVVAGLDAGDAVDLELVLELVAGL